MLKRQTDVFFVLDRILPPGAVEHQRLQGGLPRDLQRPRSRLFQQGHHRLCLAVDQPLQGQAVVAYQNDPGQGHTGTKQRQQFFKILVHGIPLFQKPVPRPESGP